MSPTHAASGTHFIEPDQLFKVKGAHGRAETIGPAQWGYRVTYLSRGQVHEVRATAEVVNVEGKRVDFKVSASDGMEEIGSGTHRRIVIDLRSFNERLAKKRSN